MNRQLALVTRFLEEDMVGGGGGYKQRGTGIRGFEEKEVVKGDS